MNLAIAIFWALAGWCGNEIRRWPRRPPQPGPWPWLSTLLSIVGGVAGGWLFSALWSHEPGLSGTEVAATAVGALIGGVLLGRLADLGSRPPAAAAPVTVDLHLPTGSPAAAADARSVAGVLESVLGERVSEARIDQVALQGGKVRFGGKDPGDPWLRTVWRRNGPILPPDDVLINPPDVSSPAGQPR